jgi:hypothetical protein
LFGSVLEEGRTDLSFRAWEAQWKGERTDAHSPQVKYYFFVVPGFFVAGAFFFVITATSSPLRDRMSFFRASDPAGEPPSFSLSRLCIRTAAQLRTFLSAHQALYSDNELCQEDGTPVVFPREFRGHQCFPPCVSKDRASSVPAFAPSLRRNPRSAAWKKIEPVRAKSGVRAVKGSFPGKNCHHGWSCSSCAAHGLLKSNAAATSSRNSSPMSGSSRGMFSGKSSGKASEDLCPCKWM